MPADDSGHDISETKDLFPSYEGDSGIHNWHAGRYVILAECVLNMQKIKNITFNDFSYQLIFTELYYHFTCY